MIKNANIDNEETAKLNPENDCENVKLKNDKNNVKIRHKCLKNLVALSFSYLIQFSA